MKKKKINHRSARKRGEKRLGSETLRPAEAWASDVEAGRVVEREKKEEGVGRRAEQIGDEGAWGGSASWSAEQMVMKVGRRAEG